MIGSRRWIVALTVLSSTLTGCGPASKTAVRPSKAADDPTAWTESTISQDGEGSGSKGFLRSTRLPGAMSSEGAEIERSLGVNR